MSILTSRKIISKSLWLLFLTIVSFNVQEIAGLFNDESYSSDSDFGEPDDHFKNDLSISANSESLADFPRGHRHFKRHHREELPRDIEIPIGTDEFDLLMDFPKQRHHSNEKTWANKDSEDSKQKKETRLSRIGEPVNEKPTMTLPSRFSYVAQQFYQYVWEKRNNPKKDVPETDESGKNSGNAQDDENNTWNGDGDNEPEGETPGESVTTVSINDRSKGPPILWRNIIDAPSWGCPAGQRKDANGRCRVALW